MHIPDNFLSTPVWASLDCVVIPAVAVVSRRARAINDAHQPALLGVLGAFVFAAQMVNFPVGIGTSGHVVGGTLLACIVGPWAAALVMTSILIVQALVFQDGGVLALGANVLNMALLGVFAGYMPAHLLSRTKWAAAGVFLGGLCSVLLSGLLALSELSISGIRMSAAMVEISLLVFTVNAIIEGAITVSALRGIQRLKPGVGVISALPSDHRSTAPRARNLAVLIGSAAILILVAGVAIGSNLPDGLDRLALRLGVPLTGHIIQAPLGDYYVRQLGMSWASRVSAGLLGILGIYLICGIAGHLLARAKRSYS
jgi:cobalt/nickel transport system permease protein